MITQKELVAKGWNNNNNANVFIREIDDDNFFRVNTKVSPTEITAVFINGDGFRDALDLRSDITIDELETLIAILSGQEQTCEWKYQVFDSWHISCRGNVEWGEGNPLEEGMAYCPYCGRKIVVKEKNVNRHRTANSG
jgi:DNA-directed RNA polymerase subunit RPC12/RpoP